MCADARTELKKSIAGDEPKPAQLTPAESVAWDQMVGQIEEGLRRGWTPFIANE